jgi:uncharacterized Zn-binding protein involved in type VI secretion
MSAAIHRHGGSRACGATTVASQTTVKAGGENVAVNGDVNSHGGGAINASGTKNVFIGGKLVSNKGDPAGADSLCIPLGGAHCAPSTTSGLASVQVGEA